MLFSFFFFPCRGVKRELAYRNTCRVLAPRVNTYTPSSILTSTRYIRTSREARASDDTGRLSINLLLPVLFSPFFQLHLPCISPSTTVYFVSIPPARRSRCDSCYTFQCISLDGLVLKCSFQSLRFFFSVSWSPMVGHHRWNGHMETTSQTPSGHMFASIAVTSC